jgi:Protein of unknown function (DUF3102).
MEQIMQKNDIKTLTEEILRLKQQTLENVIEIGKRLIEVKKNIPRGEWRDYLKDKVDFKERTAQNYMRVAREFLNTQAIADLGQTKVFALLDVKLEKREEFISKKHKVNGKEKTVQEMSTRELKQSIREYEKLEEKLKNKEEEIKNIKENILLNTQIDNMSVRFEEVEKPSTFGIFGLTYNIYFNKNGIEELVIDDCKLHWFENLDITNGLDMIVIKLENKKILLQKEKDFILAECLKFKETAIRRGKEFTEQKSREFSERFYEELFNDIPVGRENPNKLIYKKFYNELAKIFHPDRGALGNGLRVVMGAVIATGGRLFVSTKGNKYKIIPQDDGTSIVEKIGKYNHMDTKIEVELGKKDIDTEWADYAVKFNSCETYKGKTSGYLRILKGYFYKWRENIECINNL